MDLKPIIVVGTCAWGSLLSQRLGQTTRVPVELVEHETDLETLLERGSYVIDTRETSGLGLSRFGRIIHLPASTIESYTEGLDLIEVIAQTSCRLGEVREIVNKHLQRDLFRKKRQKLIQRSIDHGTSLFRIPKGSLRALRV